MITTRRRLLGGALGALALAPFRARAGGGAVEFGGLMSSLWGDRRAVYFTDGIQNNTYPSAAVNDASSAPFPPMAPAILDLPYWTNAFYWSAWLNTINQPFANVDGTFPLFGLQSGPAGTGTGVGEIVSVRILPPGLYPVFPYVGGRVNNFTPLSTQNPVLQVLVQNPQVPANSTQFLAAIDNIAIGVWRMIQVSFNPQNYPAGTGPPIVQITMGDRSQSPPAFYTAYQAPTYGAQRTPPYNFAIPVGDAFGLGNPTAWLGYQPPFTGFDPGMGWAQNNAYVGGMQQVIGEFGSFSANPGAGGNDFPGVDLYDMANEHTLMTSGGFSIPINARTLTLPNGQGPHTPTVLLQGGAHPRSAPSFLRQDFLTIDGQPYSNDFVTPGGYVDIQSITFGENLEGRDIGGPAGFE